MAGGRPALCQAPSAARDDLIASALRDASSWWGEPGRPGYSPDGWWGAAYPWTFAGHVRGAWQIVDPWTPPSRPFPGVTTADAPLGWMDSLGFATPDQASWDGFESAIAGARALSSPVRPAGGRFRARADLLIAGGSSAYDENALALSRGDSVRWGRIGIGTWNRGGVGALGLAAGHHYEVAGGWTRGRHRVSGAFAHRGAAASLELGAEQSAGGAAGALDYALGFGGYGLAVRLARAYDHHESFGIAWPRSRRDAQENSATAEWSGPERPWSGRLVVRQAHVSRVTQDSMSVSSDQTSLWLSVAGEGGRGPARFRAEMGVGREEGTQRTEIAPSLSFSFGEGAYVGRLFLGRVLAPVWSDLGGGQDPFLQSTWLGGFDLAAGGGPGFGLRGGWLMGRTRDRAVVARLPFEELWLRAGFVADPDPYDFGLATLQAEWRGGPWRIATEGYHLLREVHAVQPAVDPRRGGRASLEAGFRVFRGDLLVRLRGEAEALGGRQSEFGPATWLPGYVSFGAGAAMNLADATLAFRIRNLENQRRPQTWPDPLTGVEALGPGTEFRLIFGWRLYN